jgi:hypothetical protein
MQMRDVVRRLSKRIRELFDDGVVAVGEKALAHVVGVFAGGVGAQLDVEELVLGLVADYDIVAAMPEGIDEDVGIFLMGDGGYLDERGRARGSAVSCCSWVKYGCGSGLGDGR